MGLPGRKRQDVHLYGAQLDVVTAIIGFPLKDTNADVGLAIVAVGIILGFGTGEDTVALDDWRQNGIVCVRTVHHIGSQGKGADIGQNQILDILLTFFDSGIDSRTHGNHLIRRSDDAGFRLKKVCR